MVIHQSLHRKQGLQASFGEGTPRRAWVNHEQGRGHVSVYFWSWLIIVWKHSQQGESSRLTRAKQSLREHPISIYRTAGTQMMIVWHNLAVGKRPPITVRLSDCSITKPLSNKINHRVMELVVDDTQVWFRKRLHHLRELVALNVGER